MSPQERSSITRGWAANCQIRRRSSMGSSEKIGNLVRNGFVSGKMSVVEDGFGIHVT